MVLSGVEPQHRLLRRLLQLYGCCRATHFFAWRVCLYCSHFLSSLVPRFANATCAWIPCVRVLHSLTYLKRIVDPSWQLNELLHILNKLHEFDAAFRRANAIPSARRMSRENLLGFRHPMTANDNLCDANLTMRFRCDIRLADGRVRAPHLGPNS